MAGAETQTGSSTAGLRLLSLLAALTPLPANAGAWIAPEGGQEIWTSVVGEREGLTFYETSTYWEAPLSGRTSLVTSPWIEQSYDTDEGWRAEATIGAKRVVYRDDRNVVAVQGSGLWVSHPNERCGEGGAEVRVLGGRGFGRTGFANVEAATRALEGGCESERVDLTLGYRPTENWLAMGQVFVDHPRAGDETIRAQLTLVHVRPSGRAIQIGLRTRIDGGAQEAALVIGLWGRPGD
ncbi:MAG: hypothetical protein H7124_01825 [Phycisphaerales bacterium]|nr:hypothetical protein [Hyphomonadaceae bacterium]